MPMVKVGDINMYYEVHGEGEPLVLIMGLGGASNMWWLQVASFSREYKVVVFDNRGVGRTDKPDMTYSMAMLSDDAAGLLEAWGIPSAHVYGLSLGGMIAQDLALRYPERVMSLILGATSCGRAHAIAPSPETLQKLLDMAGLPPEEAARAGASLASPQRS